MRKMMMSNRGPRTPRMNNYEPVKGSMYFTGQNSVQTEDGSFHYYTRGETGPLIVGIHGGGYSALTWALFAEQITARVDCRMFAIDMRGHGLTNTVSSDMSLDLLAKDIAAVIKEAFPEDCPPIVLIGHSLGGAVAVEVAPMLPSVVGVAIIDIVEGTALDSLCIMQNILRARPPSFASIEAAIQWSVRSCSTSNIESAKVSMPGQIMNAKTEMLGAYEVENDIKPDIGDGDFNTASACTSQGFDVITEETDSTQKVCSSKPPLPSMAPPAPVKTTAQTKAYVWRIDLTKTEEYWSGWFTGLSQKFLDLPLPKILIMANIYGLDTCLTVGQMQGKFQLQVLPRCGHAIQEDRPDLVADIVATFIVKQRLGMPIGNFKPTAPGC